MSDEKCVRTRRVDELLSDLSPAVLGDGMMFAFWRYDQFPYVLGGPVVGGPDSTGLVQVKGYATERPDGTYGGGWFMPLLLVSVESGEQINKQLEGIRERYRAAQARTTKTFEKELAGMVPPALRPRSSG